MLDKKFGEIERQSHNKSATQEERVAFFDMMAVPKYLALLSFLAAIAKAVIITDEDFENGWGIFNDGGGDARRSSRDSSFATSGIYCIRLRDNSGAASSMFTDPFDVSSLTEVVIQFNFIGSSMENNENFFVESSTDSGPWTIEGDYVFSPGSLSNGVAYTDSVPINVPVGASTMRLRIRCDASGNGDRVYIDDVLIEGTNAGPTPTAAPAPAPTANPTPAPVPTVATTPAPTPLSLVDIGNTIPPGGLLECQAGK